MSTHEDAVRLSKDDHDPGKADRLTNLGASFTTRFERFGDDADIDQAVSNHGDAVHLVQDDHPDKPVIRSNLGRSFIGASNALETKRTLSGRFLIVGIPFSSLKMTIRTRLAI
jgi:hypothetical protein